MFDSFDSASIGVLVSTVAYPNLESIPYNEKFRMLRVPDMAETLREEPVGVPAGLVLVGNLKCKTNAPEKSFCGIFNSIFGVSATKAPPVMFAKAAVSADGLSLVLGVRNINGCLNKPSCSWTFQKALVRASVGTNTGISICGRFEKILLLRIGEIIIL
jgi:hypothetical protein